MVVTEGELDCLSVSMIQQNKWPTVSVKNGAQGAKRDVQKSLEWLESFETVVFMFDMDDAGQSAARACASVLTPGKAKIAQLPLKDANEMLMANRGKRLSLPSGKPRRSDQTVSFMALTCGQPSQPTRLSILWTIPSLASTKRHMAFVSQS